MSEGDELTIRASGASYTAIHHLVEASDSNRIPEDRWVDTEGQRKTNKRDLLRGEYRISPMSVEGILLMQVIPSNMQNNSDTWLSQTEDYLVNGQIEIIGKERRNLRISQDGVLHFAVNDIVLTDTILNKMYKDYIEDLFNHFSKKDFSKQKSNILNIFDSLGENTKQDSCILESMIKYGKSFKQDKDSSVIKYAKRKGLALGHYPICKTDSGTIDSFSKRAHDAYPIVNELVYYKQMHFRDPWFVDNIGSFLIVIERKRK